MGEATRDADSDDVLGQPEVSRHLEYVAAALEAESPTERDKVLGDALALFGPRFLHSLGELSSLAEQSDHDDPRWQELFDSTLDRLGSWLAGEQLTERADEDERRAIAAYQLLERFDGRPLLARLVANVIVELPEGHPLRDVARARALVDAYLAQPEDATDPETRLLTLAVLAGHLSDESELPGIEALATPLLDSSDPDAAVGYHVAVAGRAALSSIECRDAGDDEGRRRYLASAQPHFDALERIGGPRALLAAALSYDAVDEHARAAELYDTVRQDPAASDSLTWRATLAGGRSYMAAKDAPRAVELLLPIVPDLVRRYVDAVVAGAVEDTGNDLARTCEHLTLALAQLERWDDLTRVLDTPKSARFRARQSLRATAAGQRLLELERLILEVERGVPVDLPPVVDDPGDRLGAGVPTLTMLLETYRVDRPAIDPILVTSPGIADIAAVLHPDETAVALAMTYEGTVVVVIDAGCRDAPRATTVEPSLSTADWLGMLAGENEDGWLYAIGAPEAPIDRPLALQRLLDEVDSRFGQLLTSVLAEIPDRVCVIPHGVLHLVPFHALGCFDGAVVTTAPSAAQLVRDRRQPVSALAGRALVVADPTLDLPLSASEVCSVQAFAGTARLSFEELHGQQATESAVVAAARGAGLVHLSGHGQSDIATPDDSALLLAPPPSLRDDPFPTWLAGAEEWADDDDENRRARVPGVGALKERRLLDGDWVERTMELPERCTIWSFERGGQPQALAERWSAADMLVDDALAGCALAVLSACESALGGLNIGIDEQSGLPAALALAGTASVIATQWPVDEGVAAVSVELLYDDLSHRRGDVDLAAVVASLRDRLRRLSRDEAFTIVDRLRQRLTEPRARLLLEAMGRRLRRGPDEPFSRAWDWAAFVVVGKGIMRMEVGE